jgi:hypothetical protein
LVYIPAKRKFSFRRESALLVLLLRPIFFRCLKKIITLPNTILSFENKSTILFSDFSQHEINLNKSSKNTENALIEWLRKDTTSYFTKTIVYVVALSLFFKTVFGIFLALKLPSPFSRKTVIPNSEKTSGSLKIIILEEKLSNEFKNGHEKFLSRKVSL